MTTYSPENGLFTIKFLPGARMEAIAEMHQRGAGHNTYEVTVNLDALKGKPELLLQILQHECMHAIVDYIWRVKP